MLGMVVGAATLIIVIGIGNGASKAVEDQFASLNVNMITVMSAGRGRTIEVDENMLSHIEESSEYLKEIFLVLTASAPLSYEKNEFDSRAIGVESSFFEANSLEFEEGEAFSEEDNIKRRKKVIIGKDIVTELFEDEENIIGKYIKISGKRYEVAGVLERSGKIIGRDSMDTSVFLPYSTTEAYLVNNTAKPFILAFAGTIDDVIPLSEEITNILSRNYKSSEMNSIRIMNVGTSLETAKASARNMSIMLIAIATIILIVGGIGIMNVLFVSVKERTKEIGILKAIGAKKIYILLIFLIESLLVSLLGGFLGAIIGRMLIPFLSGFGVVIITTPITYIVAIVFTVVTGTLFGFYPAYQASNLKPFDALKYE